MDSFTHTKQLHHNYKSPRLQKQGSNDANSKNNENLRKSLAFPLDSESPAKKGVHYFTKTTSDFVTGQSGAYGPLAKAMTPKVLTNMINNVGLQDSSKKGNKGSYVDRTKDNTSLPHFYDEDKVHMDEIKITKGLEIYNGDMENQRQSFGQCARLPAIHAKKVPSRTETKKKFTRRVGLERQTNAIGLAKGEFDVVANPLNISTRGTHSNSSPSKPLGGAFKGQMRYENEEKEDVNTSLGMLCIDERGKNKGPEPLNTGVPINPIRRRYASGCARTLQCNLSGGEEEETPKENLSFSLLIAPVKGTQKTVKQIKKKVEVLKERTSPKERKDRSVDLVDLKKLNEKVVEKVKGKIRKPREEDKAQSEMLSARKKQKTAVEDKEEKKKLEDDMEVEDKEEVNDKGDDKEEKKEEIGEFAKKMIERDQEEKAEDHEVRTKEEGNKSKPKERTPKNAIIKKIGVTSPVAKEIPQETKEPIDKSGLVAAVVARANKRLQSHLHASKMMEKEKDLLQMKREHAYKEFMLRLNFSFNVKVRVPTEKTFTAYKYFLGKGNNSIMLKSMMKQRWWWVQIDNKDASDINFLWTQMKQNKFIDNLKQKRKTPFEGLDGNVLLSYPNTNDTTPNSLTSLDSGTDNESDTAENEVASAGKPVKRTKGRKNTKKSKKKEGEEAKSHEDIHTAGLKKLFTNNEIALMNTLADSKGNMPLNPGDYDEIMKLKKMPAPQMIANPSGMKMCNHLENNFHLANKKALLWNMRSYYEAIKENVFDHLPLTFHVRNGFEDKEYQKFLEYYTNREKEIEEQEKAIQESKDAKKNIKKLRNIWIVKPGENTNRGVGIHVCNDLSQINELVATTEGNINGRKRTYLIQQYLDRPFLYNKRKFDIRCYILMTCINGTMKGYWYQEGYIRTATKEFSLKNVTNKLVHLTNDAVQKKAEDYGKFEAGNKLSYGDFQKYLDHHYDGTINFNNDVYPKIRQLAIDSIRAVYGKMDPHRRENCFEVFGLDFMIDTDLRAWLIEVNTNPDINASSPALTRVIPNMVENALRLTIDQMYPPPVWQASKKQMLPENLLENNKFELVFDEVEDGPALRSILQADKGATGDLILEIVAEEEEEDAEEECKD